MKLGRETSRTVWIVAAALVLLEIAVSGQYGIFRDELYFIACGHHWQLGYVDQPPLIPWLAAGIDSLFHGSLLALRVLPALGIGALVVVGAAIARELGGNRYAQLLTALCIGAGGEFLTMAHWMTVNAFDTLLWMSIAYLIVRLINGGDERLWLWIGILSGLAILEKYAIVFFEFSFLIGLLATPERRILRSRYLLYAAVIALAMIVPNLWWQWSNHFPMWDLLRTGQESKNVPIGASGLFLHQILLENPFVAPVWIIGIFALAVANRFKPYRALAYTFAILFVLYAVLKAKDYYLSPIFPMLEAAGAVTIAIIATEQRRWGQIAIVVFVIIGGFLSAPNAIPILPVETLMAYQRAMHVHEAPSEKSMIGQQLPQHFADEFGWAQFADSFVQASAALVPGDRAQAVILVWNYGEAAALDYFARDRLRVPVVSPHNQYWLWGLHGRTGDPAIVLGGTQARRRKRFDAVTKVGYFANPYAMRYESEQAIWLCRKPHKFLSELWPLLKDYN